MRPRRDRRHFADDIFKRIFLNENIRISTKNSLKFVPKGLINNIPALFLIMAWRRPGDKPLSEPMLVRSLTHICVTRPQWVKVHLVPIWPPISKMTSIGYHVWLKLQPVVKKTIWRTSDIFEHVKRSNWLNKYYSSVQINSIRPPVFQDGPHGLLYITISCFEHDSRQSKWWFGHIDLCLASLARGMHMLCYRD